MNTVHALAFTFDADAPAALPDAQALASALAGFALPPGVDGIEVFAPHPEHARLEVFGDGPPPFALVEFRAVALGALDTLAGDGRLRTVLAGIGDAGRWRAGLFRVVDEPVPEPERTDAPAPLSMVVHYYGPVDDPAAFAAHYVEHHPVTLGRLPRIRAVLCHVPCGAPLPGWRADETVVRNEVRFDSMDDLLASMRAPQMREVRADSRAFRRFGRSTHYPMLRLRAA